MIAKVKARYTGGVLTPLEPLDLEEGEEVTLSVEGSFTRSTSREAILAGAGGWAGQGDWEDFIRMIYEARLTGSRPWHEPPTP